MGVVAYAYIDPYLESIPTPDTWGQEIDRLYLDQGPAIAPRPQLQQLLQDCLITPPSTLIVRDLAELGASLTDVIEHVDRLESQGIKVLTLDQSYCTPPDANSPNSRQDLMALAAHITKRHQSQRLKAGHARNRIQTLPPPGRAPYGYRRGRDRYALDRTAAPVVKVFFEQFLLFGSIRQAVRYVNKTYGKRISPSTGQRWLTHPAYRGDLVYQDGSTIRDTHTPIISREEAAQVDRLLRRNRRLPPKTASAPRSLAGLVRCSECDSAFKISRVTRPRQSQEYLYLRPIRCGRSPQGCKALVYSQVLAHTIIEVCDALPKAVADLEAPPVSSIKGALMGQVEQKEIILGQLSALVKKGVLDDTTAELRAYTLRSEISALEQQVSQLPPENLATIVQALSIPQFWHDLSEAERRVYLREFIQTVLVVRSDRDWTIQIRFVF